MERYKNQTRLLDIEKLRNTRFMVVGAGAIGSFFVTTLSKMGAKNITVYDDDAIEDHNISNQIYPTNTVGTKKILALSKMAQSFGDCLIDGIEAKWEDTSMFEGDVVVSAVDDMDTRKKIWDFYKDKKIKFFLDGRMSALVFKVYGVDMSNKEAMDFYESTLYPQSEAAEEPCGEKSIIFTVLAVSSKMLNQVKQFLMNEYRPTEIVSDEYNNNIKTTYHMKQEFEHIEAEQEEVMA